MKKLSLNRKPIALAVLMLGGLGFHSNVHGNLSFVVTGTIAAPSGGAENTFTAGEAFSINFDVTGDPVVPNETGSLQYFVNSLSFTTAAYSGSATSGAMTVYNNSRWGTFWDFEDTQDKISVTFAIPASVVSFPDVGGGAFEAYFNSLFELNDINGDPLAIVGDPLNYDLADWEDLSFDLYWASGASVTLQIENLAVVPEPSVFALGMGVLVLGCAIVRRRHARSKA